MSAHDIVNGVRMAGRAERLKSAKAYRSWFELAKGYEPEFFDWLVAKKLSLDEEAQEFADIGFEDEGFPSFMHRAFENDTGRGSD